MGRFFEALKAGVRGFREGTQPSEYLAAGHKIKCPHCQHTRFAPGSAMLNSAGRTFFNLDWTDPSASILVCAECGRIEWFAEEPQAVE